ncbi:hypothetical protein [Thalassovita sp.]|uniref:hypothetical protein n=1 Tax=Thalassovita sp. TaxID=1979401 RepID=UPI0029DE5128|nr:hypothetical protein [Thalassovita sp.]
MEFRIKAARPESDRWVATGPGFLCVFGGADLAPVDDTALLWLGLPVAMRQGVPLVIDGAVSRTALDGARQLAMIWAAWRPDLFEEIAISASVVTDAPANAPAGPPLLCFSGGIDSTHALTLMHARGERPDLLSVHGMDYRRDDHDRFGRLLDKTAALRKARAGRSLTVWTDAASVYRRFGIPPTLGFGFILGTAQFLHARGHRKGVIAADIARHLECVNGPYGTSSVITPLMNDGAFACALEGLQVSRMDKVAALLGDELALASLSFCKDYGTRPENCGVCPKCVRTKAQIYALGGSIPPIFRDRSLTPAHFKGISVSDPIYAEPFRRMIRLADREGRGDVFAPVRAQLEGRRAVGGIRLKLYRLQAMLKARRLRSESVPPKT